MTRLILEAVGSATAAAAAITVAADLGWATAIGLVLVIVVIVAAAGIIKVDMVPMSCIRNGLGDITAETTTIECERQR